MLTITVGLAAARLGALVAGAVGEAVRHLLAAPALRYRQMRVQGGRGETQGATNWVGRVAWAEEADSPTKSQATQGSQNPGSPPRPGGRR